MAPGNEAVLQATESWAGPENEATSYIDRQTAEQQNFIPYSGKGKNFHELRGFVTGYLRKFSLQNLEARHPLVQQKQVICESF